MSGKKVATFRERFTALIESSPKSRTTIAREFGVAKQTISAWLTGQNSPRLPVASALADYFEVNLGWLLGFDVPKTIDRSRLEEYEATMKDILSNNERLGIVTSSELSLIESYRSLTPRGQELLQDRAKELVVLYGKKSEDSSAQPVQVGE